ncbi:MAG: alpha-D-ribose 1-methylphosphonate 5-triphosphate diphosphatase [Alphaproteobacteria bacterium]|nr:alpha-D-ribose 1-methylphosphonate 5-triphosphate diphosphatase [Alphaproteobacteria bacterium]
MPDSITTQDSVTLRNVRALLPEGFQDGVTIAIHDGRITEIGDGAGPAAAVDIDGSGLTVMPGLIDLHGDAFEREMAPRPGCGFPLDLAIESNDANLISAGITTFYYSITDGFEPSVRNRATVRGLLDAIEARRDRLVADSRIHIRHECVATDDHDELLSWITDRRIDLLSLNDHLPMPGDTGKLDRYRAGAQRRFTMSPDDLERFIADRQSRRDLGYAQTVELAAAAHAAGVALASHDERTAEDAARAEELGVRICEFPLTAECAEKGLARGAAVVMGAPNLVRGGSHVGGTSVRDEIAEGRVSILVSDYFYPSLLRAPFLIAELGLLPLEKAWELVSGNPAEAVGLGARKGRIAVGADADLIGFRGASGLAGDIALVSARNRLRRTAA